MNSLGLDTGQWRDFWTRWEAVAGGMPQRKGELLNALGEKMADTVRREVDASGIRDGRGRVKSWQNPHVGTRSGYVAVRPDSVEVEAGNQGKQKLSAGALTTYLAAGHRIRKPSDRSKRYKQRIRERFVTGRKFYKLAGERMPAMAKAEAETWLRNLTEELSQ